MQPVEVNTVQRILITMPTPITTATTQMIIVDSLSTGHFSNVPLPAKWEDHVPELRRQVALREERAKWRRR